MWTHPEIWVMWWLKSCWNLFFSFNVTQVTYHESTTEPFQPVLLPNFFKMSKVPAMIFYRVFFQRCLKFNEADSKNIFEHTHKIFLWFLAKQMLTKPSFKGYQTLKKTQIFSRSLINKTNKFSGHVQIVFFHVFLWDTLLKKNLKLQQLFSYKLSMCVQIKPCHDICECCPAISGKFLLRYF